ncbi:trehalose-phosphatase [Shinella curvata]|uniref:Trehalose 6-phosphate phosphatase n=1 Tax=Shinella curvata TaxID=1817964 RepID=A0ABT8XKB1_9HYPH|nr:trehalose-phosphatase [Shinella curvata]MCJ8052540.1 trehalose-phosphatase [Shinella curvata]MDO6123620.1 trehalose-phosphatase [Shinella curvata]
MDELEKLRPTDAATRHLVRRLIDEPDRWALFLDIDGTLLDLAATPDAIQVPLSLPGDLQAVAHRLKGALALVTGRSLSYADALFTPCRFPIAGLHGAEFRGFDGQTVVAAATPAFVSLKQRLIEQTTWMEGVLIEDKGAAVAAHYRLAPAFDSALEGIMRSFAEEAGPDWVLQPGKMVFEIRPARADKGDAVATYLEQPAFAGRMPIAIGDDLTDETMFALANARGGQSIRVGSLSTPTCALAKASSPSAIRSALSTIAAAGEGPAAASRS